MSQKSNHYFAHGVISIIIQGMHDMKIIYFPYSDSRPCQEYQYVSRVNILTLTLPDKSSKITPKKHLNSFIEALFAILCFYS